GAGRLRLVRQLLAESTLISLVGGAAGLAVASFTERGLIASLPGQIVDRLPVVRDLSLDATSLWMALAGSLLTVALAGIVPAIDVSRPSTGVSAARFGRSHRLRDVLVVAEAALAVILVIGAGLAIRSLSRVLDVRPGFEPKNLLSMQIMLPAA